MSLVSSPDRDPEPPLEPSKLRSKDPGSLLSGPLARDFGFFCFLLERSSLTVAESVCVTGDTEELEEAGDLYIAGSWIESSDMAETTIKFHKIIDKDNRIHKKFSIRSLKIKIHIC